jgi:hypothetical protein
MGVNAQIDRDDKLVDIEHGFVFMKPLDPLIALVFGDKTLSSKLVAHRVIMHLPLELTMAASSTSGMMPAS